MTKKSKYSFNKTFLTDYSNSLLVSISIYSIIYLSIHPSIHILIQGRSRGTDANNKWTYLVSLIHTKLLLSEFYGFHSALVFMTFIQFTQVHFPKEQFRICINKPMSKKPGKTILFALASKLPHKVAHFCSFLSRGSQKVKESEVAQSCPTLCDPLNCSVPGFSVHGIFQARILEWVAISLSRGSSQPRDWTRVSHIVGRLALPSELPGKPPSGWDIFTQLLTPLAESAVTTSPRITHPSYLSLSQSLPTYPEGYPSPPTQSSSRGVWGKGCSEPLQLS